MRSLYHHEIVVELREYCFDSFTEPLVSPSRWSPVFLIQPIRNFKSDIGRLKEIFLDFGTEVTFVFKHHAATILSAHILKIMEIMNACGCHVIRMYDTTYSVDGMEFITIILQILRRAISLVGSGINIVVSHNTTFCPCVLTHLDWFGINAEYVLGAINGHSHILADFLCKAGRQLTTSVELSATGQVWQIILALMVQTIKKEIFTIESGSFGCYAESNDFEIGELWNNTTTRYVSEVIYTISGEICYEVAHKQCDST